MRSQRVEVSAVRRLGSETLTSRKGDAAMLYLKQMGLSRN